jgi:hypothetical protein
MLDGGAPHGRHYYWKAHRLPTISDDVIEIFLDRIDSIPNPFSQLNGWAVGGTVSGVDHETTAVAERDDGFEINAAAGWPPADPDSEAHRAWVRDGWEALRPHAAGVYANFLSDEGVEGLESAYGKERLARLTTLKDRFDPTNFFRMNPNIPPSASGAGPS